MLFKIIPVSSGFVFRPEIRYAYSTYAYSTYMLLFLQMTVNFILFKERDGFSLQVVGCFPCYQCFVCGEYTSPKICTSSCIAIASFDFLLLSQFCIISRKPVYAV